MDGNGDVAGRQKYGMSSYIVSNEEDNSDWFILEIRLNGRSFRIEVSTSQFYNSPSQTRRFEACLAFLRADRTSEGKGKDESEEKSEETCSINDCFCWAVDPCLVLFECLAPPPANNSALTLHDFFHSESFSCQLGAIDDRLVPGPIEQYQAGHKETPPPKFDDEHDVAGSPWATTFPTYYADQLRVIHNGYDNSVNILDIIPNKIALDDQVLYFKAIQPPDDRAGQREVEVYEQIAEADFGTEVRTSRLYGVVLDKGNQLIGLLLYPITIDDTLKYKLVPESPGTLKERWTEQIQTTVRELHSHGIIWGDAKPDNILIDIHGDAWVVDFGGGHTQGWVDRANAETIEGDLEGLENILAFISTGGTKAG